MKAIGDMAYAVYFSWFAGSAGDPRTLNHGTYNPVNTVDSFHILRLAGDLPLSLSMHKSDLEVLII